jgi:hypothetical protein
VKQLEKGDVTVDWEKYDKLLVGKGMMRAKFWVKGDVVKEEVVEKLQELLPRSREKGILYFDFLQGNSWQ